MYLEKDHCCSNHSKHECFEMEVLIALGLSLIIQEKDYYFSPQNVDRNLVGMSTGGLAAFVSVG